VRDSKQLVSTLRQGDSILHSAAGGVPALRKPWWLSAPPPPQGVPSSLFSPTGTISLLTEQEPTHTTTNRGHNLCTQTLSLIRLASSPQIDKSKSGANCPSSHPAAGILPDATTSFSQLHATGFSQLRATDPKNLSLCITLLAPDAIGDMAAS